MRQKLLGEEQNETAEAYNLLALNQYAQGKYGEAERGLTRALDLRLKILGEEHPDTATTYNNLAFTQKLAG